MTSSILTGSIKPIVFFNFRNMNRVSHRGGPGIPPPPTPQPQISLPRNLEIEYGYYLHVTERKYVSSNVVRKFCPRLCQKQSERYINSKFPWGGGGGGGGGMPPDPPSRHACVSHTTIILLPSCPPPPQLKILYETLMNCCVQTWVLTGSFAAGC